MAARPGLHRVTGAQRALIGLLGDDHASVMVEYGLVLSLLSIPFILGMEFVEIACGAALTDVQKQLLDYGLEIVP